MDLRERFPGLEPITKAPSMQLVNGIGTRLYGKRDFDPETNTYIATLCFCVLFIPLFALKAFRVLPDGNGWYFLGRMPLSTYAKGANVAVLIALASLGGSIWWSAHTGTAEYKAGQQMASAKADADAGRVAQAAAAYRSVFGGATSHREAAFKAVVALAGKPLDKASAADAAQVIATALAMNAHGESAEHVNLYQRGIELIDLHAAADPAGAIEIASLIAPLTKDQGPLDEKRLKLLENLVKSKPTDVAILSQLAGIYERKEQFDRCEALLAPVATKLGESEGARILGQIYAGQNKLEESFALLNAYTTARLKRLHDAEQAYNTAYEAAAGGIIAELNRGMDANFNARYEKASEAEKPVIVDDYIWTRLKDRPDIVDYRNAMARESDVVPVALDLGIVRLRRAQGMPDPAQRKKELEAAEQTFLAIKGQAGQSDTYNRFLGQVNYWLGKHAQGKAIFDQMLAKNGRNFATLATIASTLREVGEVSQARLMAEEAYDKATQPREKHSVAEMRAVMHKDEDDEVLWLGRANPAEPDVKASLASAQGKRATRKGDWAAAATHLREAVAIYRAMPVTPASLNNGAIACFNLFYVTGDLADLNTGIEMQEKALALLPGDSILLLNTAHVVTGAALREVIGNAIDFKLLRASANTRMIGHFFTDDASRAAFVQKLRGNASFNKAVSYYERGRVLSAKNDDPYAALSYFHSITRNAQALRLLAEQARAAGLDLHDQIAQTLEFYKGEKDEKYHADTVESLKRGEERLAEVRAASPNGATLALAIESVLEGRIAAARMGIAIDHDQSLALAQEWHKAAPSVRSQRYLVDMLLSRAAVDLMKEDTGFAQMASLAQRSMGYPVLMAIALQRGGSLSQKAAANSHVRRAAALLIERHRAFPKDGDPFAWAVLKATNPAEAESVAAATRASEVERLDLEIDLLLTPVDAGQLMSMHWMLLIDGKTVEAEKLIKDAIARGVPMP